MYGNTSTTCKEYVSHSLGLFASQASLVTASDALRHDQLPLVALRVRVVHELNVSRDVTPILLDDDVTAHCNLKIHTAKDIRNVSEISLFTLNWSMKPS